MANNSTTHDNLTLVQSLRTRFEDATADVPRSARFQIGDIVDQVEKLSALELSQRDIRYLQELNLITPDKEERGYYAYSRENLRDILVIKELQKNHGFSLAAIGGLLVAECRAGSHRGPTGRDEAYVAKSQIERGQFFWRSHLVGVALSLLYSGTVPPDSRVLLRTMPIAARNNGKPAGVSALLKERDFVQIRPLLDSQRQDDLRFVTARDAEVLHAETAWEWEEWIQLSNRGYRWFSLQCINERRPSHYQGLVCLPNASEVEILGPDLSAHAELLDRLLHACFLEISQRDIEEDDRLDISTQLRVMVNLIPDISPLWQYCAVLTPPLHGATRLGIIAISASFPRTVPLTSQVSLNEFLSGVAYRNKRQIELPQSVGSDDPRLALQRQEQAAAAVATPIMMGDEAIGILYVATRKPPPKDAYTETELVVLRVIADIVGELLQIGFARDRTRHVATRFAGKPSIVAEPWDYLSDAIAEVVQEVESDAVAVQADKNLHLVAVDACNYQALYATSPQIAQWAVTQLQQTAYEYYASRRMGRPRLFVLSPSRFALLLPRASWDEDFEHRLRVDLRAELNAMTLPFDAGAPTRIECALWSLPFAYDGLRLRLRQIARLRLIQDIVHELESAFAKLRHIHLAHQYEQEGAWHAALEEHYVVHSIDPDSVYTWRHIAKLLVQLRDFEAATDWWERVIGQQEHPSHYRHLAYCLACLGAYEQAAQACENAIELDGTHAKSYLEWANALQRLGRHDEAVSKLILAIRFDPDNAVTYHLRIAEIHQHCGRYTEALRACSQAGVRDPDNPDLALRILKIIEATRAMTAAEPDLALALPTAEVDHAHAVR